MAVNRGNFVIVGSSIRDFARCVSLMQEYGLLWSCGCDKTGDWACSTQDDVDLSDVLEVADLVDPGRNGVDVYRAGELVFTLAVLVAIPSAEFWREVHACSPMIDDASLVPRTC